MNSDIRLREQLVEAWRHRALLDMQIWRTLRDEIGSARAEALLKQAQFAHGHSVGTRFKKFAPSDLHGLADAFLSSLPGEGRLFDPQVIHCDSQRLEIRLRRTPWLSAWREAGAGEAEVETLAGIAAAMWAGAIKGAGFRFVGESWKRGGGDDSHVLHIERASPSHPEDRHHDHPAAPRRRAA